MEIVVGVTIKVSSSDKGRKIHAKFTIHNFYKNNLKSIMFWINSLFILVSDMIFFKIFFFLLHHLIITTFTFIALNVIPLTVLYKNIHSSNSWITFEQAYVTSYTNIYNYPLSVALCHLSQGFFALIIQFSPRSTIIFI